MVPLTATATRRDIVEMKESLNLTNPLEIIGNPNRPNIMYKRDDTDCFEELLKPIANELKHGDMPINDMASTTKMVRVRLQIF